METQLFRRECVERFRMSTAPRKTVQLGELVVAVFDMAARFSTDQQETSRLGSGVVMLMFQSLRAVWPASA